MMEDTKRKIEVMQAYEDGKKIQVKACGFSEWRDCTREPDWDWVTGDYRVKPEEKYRPYKDYHEMIEDFCDRFGVKCSAHEMPMIWLKQKDEDYVYMISIFQMYNGTDIMESHFKKNTYLDGSPVGKKVEE